MMKIVALSAVAAVSLGASATTAFAGDAAAGEALWRNCRSCHSITAPDGTVIQRGGRTGPNLYGLPGRAPAAVEGFRYSAPMQEAGANGLIWTPEELDSFLADPRAYMRGTRMSFRGLRDAGDRQAIIAYLQSQSQ